MKKLLLAILITFLSVQYCYAVTTIPKELRKQYKADMTQAINNILDNKNVDNLTYREYFTKVYTDELNWYNNIFLQNKNQMKRNYEYIKKIENCNAIINSYPELWISTLHPIMDKYNIEKDEAYYNFGYIYKYYLKKYHVPRSKNFMLLVSDTWKYQMNILEIRDSISKYGKEYETKKAENFYNNVVKPKIDANQPYWVIPYLEQNSWDTKTRYAGNATVIQILKGGFLVDFAPGDYSPYFNTVAFIKANDSYKLKYGDHFDPYLPFKFTGQYYTYQTYLGERKSVPIFVIAMKQKPFNLPQMSDTFYFIDKPNWGKQQDYSLDSLYVINERRFTIKNRDVYARYR